LLEGGGERGDPIETQRERTQTKIEQQTPGSGTITRKMRFPKTNRNRNRGRKRPTKKRQIKSRKSNKKFHFDEHTPNGEYIKSNY